MSLDHRRHRHTGHGADHLVRLASTLTVSGGSPSFAGLTAINGSNIYVSGGVNLTLPSLTEYTGGSGYSTTLEASGAGSVLDLPNVTTWEGRRLLLRAAIAQVSALSGGEVSLPALTTDKGGLTHILAQGTGSIVDLSPLTNLISDQGCAITRRFRPRREARSRVPA